jgi:pimeloyl-ACP methyl ester carboxylesterase
VEIVRANGLEIAYQRVGEGAPLVLVHGAAVDGRMWRPQLAALADEFTVVAWDEPGAGGSSAVPADFALADYANGWRPLSTRSISVPRMSPVCPGAAPSRWSSTVTIPSWSRA